MRHLILIVIIAAAFQLFTIAYPTEIHAQAPQTAFEIGRFLIEVDPASVLINGQRPPGGQWRPGSSATDMSGKVFSGKGFSSIKNIRIAVSFNNIRLELVNQKFRATSGTVSGTHGEHVTYSIDSVDVSITRDSVRLTPATATAKVDISTPLDAFTARLLPGIRGRERVTPDAGLDPALLQELPSHAKLKLSSSSCEIAPDGSIHGTDFQGALSAQLKDSVYHLETEPSGRHSARLGPAFQRDGNNEPGIHITGVASRDNISIFTFNGTIRPDERKADFVFTFRNDFVRNSVEPETGYIVQFKDSPTLSPDSSKRSQLIFKYDSGKLMSCEGTVWADITLPSALKNDTGQRIVMKNVLLKTDKSGALHARVPKAKLPKLFAGYRDDERAALFMLEALDSEQDVSAWLYFKIWHKDHSSLHGKCDELISPRSAFDVQTSNKQVNRSGRPGLTLFYGALYFKAPQITFGQAGNVSTGGFNLKTLFRGALTVTEKGFTGVLASAAESFIAAGEPDFTNAMQPVKSHRYTWEEMIPMVNKPEPTPERFRLAGLRILGMRADKLSFCDNATVEKSFRYSVHFPFPSYIDLEFEDKSMNDQGMFSTANGPVSRTTVSAENAPDPDLLGSSGKYLPRKSVPVPATYFLWAWRLPITFSDRGVKIQYTSGSNTEWKADATITMNDTITNSEIDNSEIHVRPLYSKNSALKAGLRFSGSFDGNGNFKLIDYDRLPFFSKTYNRISPANDRYGGFDTKDIAITLADKDSHPTQRPYDLSWTGSLQFPFFSWQAMTFEAKDIIPAKRAPQSFSSREKDAVDCNGDLRLGVDSLEFSYNTGNFTSNKASGQRMPDMPFSSGGLVMASFTSAVVNTGLPQLPEKEITKDLPSSQTVTACSSSTARHFMVNPVESSGGLIDLVCYDDAARNARGIAGACCNNSLLGKYEVRKNGHTIFSMTNARAYPWPGPIQIMEAGGSEISLASLDPENSYQNLLNAPGAQLAVTDGKIQGAFGSTLTSVASSLPYEGEFRFLLDTHCGYYYLQTAGSFTYVLRFSGELFLVHAPYSDLKSNPFGTGVVPITNIIDDVWQRALFHDRETFKNAVGLGDLDQQESQKTVLTGILTAGNVSGSFGGVSLASGPGLFLFHKSSENNTKYSFGLFSNAYGEASYGILSASISDSLVYPKVISSESQGDNRGQIGDYLNLMKSGDFRREQALNACICGDAWIGHCEAGFSCTLACSVRSGLDFGCNDIWGHCASGGCSCAQ